MGIQVFTYGSARAYLSWVGYEREAQLSNLESVNQRLGHGTKVMGSVLTYADDRGLGLYLGVQQFGPDGMNNEQLEAWYSKFGFVRLPGPRPRIMHRPPRD